MDAIKAEMLLHFSVYISISQVKVSLVLSHLIHHEFEVQSSRSLMSDSLQPHELQHAKASLSITNSWNLLRLMPIELVMPSSHLVLCCVPFSCPKSLPASGSFPMSQLLPVLEFQLQHQSFQ